MTAAGGLRALPRDPLPQGAIEALVSGRHGDSFAVLGPHRIDGGFVVRVFRPGMARALLIDPVSGEPLAEFARIHQEGLFSAIRGDAAERRSLESVGRGDVHGLENDVAAGLGGVLGGTAGHCCRLAGDTDRPVGR